MALIAIKRKADKSAPQKVEREEIAVEKDTIALSGKAAIAILERLADEQKPDGVFRVKIEGGGCNGLSYVFAVDDKPGDDDIVVARDGARVVVDPRSMRALGGTILDFHEELGKRQFLMRNPNASSSCSCGSSFSL